jgi:hypothetical protein
MTDSQIAINLHSNEASQALQEKLEKLTFLNPNTGKIHSWKKSSYMKSLALKVQQSLDAINVE